MKTKEKIIKSNLNILLLTIGLIVLNSCKEIQFENYVSKY